MGKKMYLVEIRYETTSSDIAQLYEPVQAATPEAAAYESVDRHRTLDIGAVIVHEAIASYQAGIVLHGTASG